MLNGIDTIAWYFANRLKTVNPTRRFMGYMSGQPWPPNTLVFDAYYLLTLSNKPVLGESIGVPIYSDILQFTWVNRGTDINNFNNLVGNQLGDRVRVRAQMKEELVKALWPFFTQKVHLTAQSDGSVTAQTLNEPVSWTKPDFKTISDRASGLDYVTATVRLVDMTETITS